VDLSCKGLKAHRLTRYKPEAQSRQSEITSFEAGRLKIQKRSGFLDEELGRQAVVYMEGVLIVGLVSFQDIFFV